MAKTHEELYAAQTPEQIAAGLALAQRTYSELFAGAVDRKAGPRLTTLLNTATALVVAGEAGYQKVVKSLNMSVLGRGYLARAEQALAGV